MSYLLPSEIKFVLKGRNRNRACPCGSGLKVKDCHYRIMTGYLRKGDEPIGKLTDEEQLQRKEKSGIK